jgi:hypothetical protein
MAKVKLFAAIPRKAGLSAIEFHDHWRHPHGTVGRRISTIRKYVQSHHIECSLLDAKQTRYEGIAEVWMDSVGDALGLSEEPTYVRDAVPDEPHFIDLSRLRFLITEEDVLISGPDRRESLPVGDSHWYDDDRAVNIKLIQLIEPQQPGGWRLDDEAALGRALGALRHVCCHPSSEAYSSSEPPFSGVRELWWPTLSAFYTGVTSAPAAWKQLIEARAQAITVLTQSERFK